ncbi:MAG: GAF domain-containing protein, partial [Pseudomonadota bacterium]
MKMALDDASGSPVATNFEILNWVFERKVGPKELQEILHALSADGSGSLVKWTSIVLMRVAALMEVTNCTSESLSLNDMLPRLMTIVTRALDADRSTLFLHDAQTGELFSRVAQGGEVSEIRISSTQGIAGTVFSEGEALTIDDAYSDDRFNPDVDKRTGYKTQTILCSPLRKKTGEIIGVSQALNKNGGRFSPDDLSLMEAMTRQAAAALETAQLLEQVERAQREEAQLLEFFTEISSELQLDLLLAKIVKVATSFLNADRGTLFLYDPNTNELWSRVAEGEDSRDIRVSIDDGIAGACFQSGETLHIADAYDDDRFNRDVDRKTGYRTRNILCMPIINKHGKAIGVMQVLN